MGSCVGSKIIQKPKTTLQTPTISQKEHLSSLILSLHRLNLTCKSNIESCGVSKDFQTATLLKEKQVQIQVHLKEVRDLIGKIDRNSELKYPDKSRAKYLEDQGARILKEIKPEEVAKEIEGVLNKNVVAMRSIRKTSEKMNLKQEEIEGFVKQEFTMINGPVIRKKYRRSTNTS